MLHPCFAYCGTIQSCCVPSSTRLTVEPSSTRLTVDIRCAFNYTYPSLSLVYYFLTIHLFYSTTHPPPHLHLYTEPRLMSSTEVKTYRNKERKKERKKTILRTFWFSYTVDWTKTVFLTVKVVSSQSLILLSAGSRHDAQ